MPRAVTAVFAFAVVLFAVAAPAALTTANAASAYAEMEKQLYSTSAVPLPAAGITITRDTATWTLVRGQIRLMQPAPDGTITGFVFEGEGRFTMTIPDPVERAQLRRFAARDIASLDTTFSQLVGRFSNNTINTLFPSAAGPWSPDTVAQKRLEAWIIDSGEDVDAKILSAQLNSGALEIMVGMNTADYGWMSWEYDSSRAEPIRLSAYVTPGRPEVWISLARSDERTAEGRPRTIDAPVVQIDHLDIKGDLTQHHFLSGTAGQSREQIVAARFTIDETLLANRDGISALRMDLNRRAQKLVVKDAAGTPLTVIRDPVGKRTIQLGNDVWDHTMTILLPQPLAKGERRHLIFAYELELANYAPGGGWYPDSSEPAFQPYTARMELTVGRGQELRAMGRRESERETDAGTTSVWIVDKPARMITFSTSSHFTESVVEVKGIPKVITFGPSTLTWSTAAMMHNVAADVANSLQFYQGLLDDPVGGDTIYATSITAGHGQAFDGFLHLSEYTFKAEHPGASELFRAHEVAHEWWGHRVGWKSYRDQWLSESLAEYSAMMFVRSQVRGGDGYFNDILDAYTGAVLADLRGTFSKFRRPWAAADPGERNRIGPIGFGWRASTGRAGGYYVQSYIKGPLVIHMLRQLLYFKSGSDDLFVKILRDFEHAFSGKEASTEDLERVVEHDTQANWRPFFDSWINSADLPSYDWNYRQEGDKILVTIQRSGVPEGFTAFIPILIEYADGSVGAVIIPNQKSEQTVRLPVTKKIRNLKFAPDYSLLAHIRRH